MRRVTLNGLAVVGVGMIGYGLWTVSQSVFWIVMGLSVVIVSTVAYMARANT